MKQTLTDSQASPKAVETLRKIETTNRLTDTLAIASFHLRQKLKISIMKKKFRKIVLSIKILKITKLVICSYDFRTLGNQSKKKFL